MEKKEFQQIFKSYMKGLGFKTKRNRCYKYLDDDYLIAVWLDHYPFDKAYYVCYGAVYMPDEYMLPHTDLGDWESRFEFTTDPNDDLNSYDIVYSKDRYSRKELVEYFEYDIRTEDDFIRSMDINMREKFSFLYDKEYVINLYRENWILFRMIPYEIVRKIATLCGYDPEEVIKIRDSRHNSKTFKGFE